MKSLKKLFLWILISGIFLLTGCGIHVSTDLSVNENFKGNRTITCFVSRSDMLQYFKGDNAKIDTIISNNCPDPLSYTMKETGKGTEFIFELHFQSLDEYKTALGSVLNFSPEITFHGSDSIFSKGLKLTENFSSIDLLRWFEVLLTDEYSISDKQLENLWEIGDTKVKFADQEYKSEKAQIQINSVEYADFGGIDIYTTEKEDRSYERLIRFKIPTSTLDKHALELENFFADRLPENATAYWVPTKTGKNYELTIYSDSFRDLSEQTAFALVSKDHQVTVSSTFDDYQFFQYNQERMEQLDFSYFLCTEDGEVPVTYYYKPNSITKADTEKIRKKINNNFTGKTDKNGYYCLFDSTCTSLNVGFLSKMTLPVTSYQITTTLKDKGILEREFVFSFQNYLRNIEIKRLESFFEKNNTSRLQMSGDFKSETGTLRILQTGNKDSLNYSSRLLFGSEHNSIDYKKGHSIFTLYPDTSLKEQIDLSRFLTKENAKVTGSYSFLEKSSEKLKKFSLTSDQSDISYQETNKNDVYQATVHGKEFTAFYAGTIFYPRGIITLFVLGGLLAGFMWLLIKKNPMKTK